jgi:hypothetical protein
MGGMFWGVIRSVWSRQQTFELTAMKLQGAVFILKVRKS